MISRKHGYKKTAQLRYVSPSSKMSKIKKDILYSTSVKLYTTW